MQESKNAPISHWLLPLLMVILMFVAYREQANENRKQGERFFETLRQDAESWQAEVREARRRDRAA